VTLRTLPTAIAALLSLNALTACDDGVVSEACSSHDDCADTELCVRDHCQPAYEQRFVLTIVSASYLPDTTPEDAFWDETGGGPDPYLVLSDQDGNQCTTSPREDSVSPTWNHDCGDTFDIEETTLFSWVVYEDDEDTDDPVMAESAEGDEFPITVEWLRSEVFSSSSNGVTINFRVEVR
jgi:hypothetical protein